MALEAGDGIRLSEIRRADKSRLVSLVNNREIHRCTLRIPFPYTDDHCENWFARQEAKSDQQIEQAPMWAIRDAADQLLGAIGLDAAADHAHRAEIGYWLGQPYWGRGIMTAAVRAVCRHAFEDLGLAKITAEIFSFNDASARVVEKCGFEFEGYLKRHYLKDGEFIDARAYGLLR
jgi:[ribosomal protein S5]-alanine N-acetyltransferase